jgi:NitT/TauT family transport system substrate-binding protein
MKVAILSLVVPALLLAACGGGPAPASAPANSAAAPASVGASASPKPATSGSSAAANATPGGEGSAGALTKVTFGDRALAAEVQVYLGIDRGYFKDVGLDVELVPFAQAADLLPAVISNKVSFGATAVDPSIFNASARDIPVKVVAYMTVLTATDSTAAFVVRSDLVDSGRYKELKDFTGMTMALPDPPGGQTTYFQEKLAAKAGISPKDINTTIVPFGSMAAAFANKAIDASLLVDPFKGAIEQQGLVKDAIEVGAFLPGFPAQVLYMSGDFARGQPETAQRFMVGYLRGARDYYKAMVLKQGGSGEVLKTLQAHTPVKDLNVLAKQPPTHFDPNGLMDPGPIADIQDAFLRYGSAKQKLDVNQLVDGSYAAYAVQQLGKM